MQRFLALCLSLLALAPVQPAIAFSSAPRVPMRRATMSSGAFRDLGTAARRRGDLAEAKAQYERALAIEEQRAPDSVAVGAILNSLAQVLFLQGDLTGARERWQRALRIYEVATPDSVEVALILQSLGAVAMSQKAPAQAEVLWRRAAAIAEKAAPEAPVTVQLFNMLGRRATFLGDLTTARQFLERAVAITDRRAPRSRAAASSLLGLGHVEWRQGNLGRAKELMERALTIQEGLPRANRQPVVLTNTLRSLAGILDESGDRRGAIALLRRALQSSDAPSAAGRQATMEMQRHLARLLVEEGAPAEAADLLKSAARIEESGRGWSRDAIWSDEGTPRAIRPEVRFLQPEPNSEVQGDSVALSVQLVAPLPLARYYVWINGRPFGGEKGIALATPVEKGRILERGRILDKGGQDAAPAGVPSQNEDALAVDDLAPRPGNRYSQQVKLTLPVEDTDGAYLRIAVTVETTGGTVSDRQILRLRRPHAEGNRGALRVLAIGVGAYTRAPRLAYAAADARDLAAALQAQAGAVGAVREPPLRLYREAKVKVLTDAEATLPAIRAALAWFTRDVQPGETLMLALSGHGFKEGSAFYFAPVDVDPSRVASTGLPWKEVLAPLEAVRRQARSVWVLADCCRAAPDLGRARQATTEDLWEGVEEGGNLVICTASSGDTPSYESPTLKHGLFTQAWLEALRGEAPAIVYEETARGRVLPLSGLQFVIDAGVRKYAREAGVRQQVQFPRLEGSFSPGQPIFVPVPGTNVMDRKSGGGRLLER